MNFYRQLFLLSFLTGTAILSSFAANSNSNSKSENIITVSPSPGENIDHQSFDRFVISIHPSYEGVISVNEEAVWNTRAVPSLTCGSEVIPLTPIASEDKSEYYLVLDQELPEGEWTLDIPEDYFRIDPKVKEVDRIDYDSDELMNLNIFGAWHKEGDIWSSQAMFTIHDDDTLDGTIPSSNPSDWMKGGYFSTLFPVLESLGLKACLSMEGWRVGFTETPPVLNPNGIIAKRLQDEKGYEIQSHSMTARYQTNSWLVESLDSELADKILEESTYAGLRSNTTTSVYDRETGKSYYASSDKSRWIETPTPWIKPYVGDYHTKKIIMYNPTFPIDYQWGEWFRVAESLGIHGNAWVTPGPTASHAIIPLINEVCPNGFESDGVTFYNLPPLHSTATRLMMEGQAAPGYKGEQTTDNTFNLSHYEFFKRQIDEAADKGAWIVLGLHAYRPCWVNSLPGALVSEGGDYPDEWVYPMSTVDPQTGDLTPAPALGITSWSEWYPCPGTRLAMLYDLLKYAKEKDMLNVTTSEAIARIGNTSAAGYYIDGIQLGNDLKDGILGTRPVYPHYVKGANGEESYYNYATSGHIHANYNLYSDIEDLIVNDGSNDMIRAVSVEGLVYKVKSLEELPAGLWIINGQKVLRR